MGARAIAISTREVKVLTAVLLDALDGGHAVSARAIAISRREVNA